MSAPLFGTAPRPTSRYARIVYDGTTIDILDPLAAIQFSKIPQVGVNVAPVSHQREVLDEGDESQVTFRTQPQPADMCELLSGFLDSWGNRGEQFELYIDRFLRSAWGFQNTLADNNGGAAFVLASVLGPPLNPTDAVPAYTTWSDGSARALTLPSTGVLRAALAYEGNAFVSADAEGGTLVLKIKPSWAFGDSAEHVIFDLVTPSNYGINRLTLVKRGDNVLHLVYVGGNGAATLIEPSGVTWLANTEHTIQCQWKALADLKLKVDGTTYATKKYYDTDGAGLVGDGGFVGATTATPGGSEQIWSAAPSLTALGVDNLGLHGRAAGSVNLLALYRVVYATEMPPALDNFRMPWPTYWPKAELLPAAYDPQRVSPGQELYVYVFRARKGV